MKTLKWMAIALLALMTCSVASRAATQDPRTKWWTDARFGMFIHWGLYAVPADGEWHQYEHKMQVKDYEKFATQFNPVNFDAHKWVKAAKDAGMKYIVITTKHHDGFDMFDSKTSDYTVVKSTPWHHDPLKDLAAECKKQGIRLGFYHSVMDWHHPDYLPRRPWETETRPADGASLDKYIKYMESQLTELLTNYGPAAVIWFDGGWEHSPAELHAQEVSDLIHRLQPNTLINDRIDIPNDFSTPEQHIPAGALPDDRLWETCMTMNDHWGYARDDNNWKSTADLVQKLCDIASKGGNFLLNVGPTDMGVFPPEAINHLAQVGGWMKANGDSIYGTSKSPFHRLAFDGRCTQKGDTLYLQVFHWPDGGLHLAGLHTAVESARALDGGQKLTVTPGAGGPVISAPSKFNPYATVIAVKLQGLPEVDDDTTVADASGVLNLTADNAVLHGPSLQVETTYGAPSIGSWIDASGTAAWPVHTTEGGDYAISVELACPDSEAGSSYVVRVAGLLAEVHGQVPSTGNWGTFQTVPLTGVLHLPAGMSTVRLVPTAMAHSAFMNLRRVILTPVTPSAS